MARQRTKDVDTWKAPFFWIPVVNQDPDEESVPPFGLMEPFGVDSEGRLKVRKPTKDSSREVLVGSEAPIPYGFGGRAHQEFPGIVAYDQAETPDAGDEWGTADGSWLLNPGRLGFRIHGAASNGLVNASKLVPESSWLKITGGPDADGNYPAKVSTFSVPDLAFTDWETCLAREANGDSLVPGRRYRGWLAGYNDSSAMFLTYCCGGSEVDPGGCPDSFTWTCCPVTNRFALLPGSCTIRIVGSEVGDPDPDAAPFAGPVISCNAYCDGSTWTIQASPDSYGEDFKQNLYLYGGLDPAYYFPLARCYDFAVTCSGTTLTISYSVICYDQTTGEIVSGPHAVSETAGITFECNDEYFNSTTGLFESAMIIDFEIPAPPC